MNKAIELLNLIEATNVLKDKQYPGEPLIYDLYLFHTTSPEYWPSIRKSGLVSGKRGPLGQSWAGRYSGKGIYYHQVLPVHELDNCYDRRTGDFYCMTIELKTRVHNKYVVPDEEFGEPEDILKVVKNKEPVVVGINPGSRSFIALHLPDTKQARDWAAKNAKIRTVFHK